MKREAEREPLLRVWICDLQLLGAVFLARLMVWRELRRKTESGPKAAR